MKTVLIADDSQTALMLVKTTLQRIPGLEFLAAGNGKEALALMGQKPVDLLVTDINMPEMDGISLVREVRKTKTARELPILIITAKGEDEARDQGLALGANAYVLKPLSGKELFDLARKLLEAAPAVEV